MGAPLAKQLETARQRAEIERLRLASKALKSLRNGYDFANPDIANRKRRPLVNETGKREDQIFDKLKRDRGIAFTRDLARNSAGAQSIVRQIVHNSVGTMGGKVSAKTGDEAWDQAATKYFNRWSRDCGYRRPMRFNQFLRYALGARYWDGDIAWTVDPDLSDGRILSWETDQVRAIDAAEWEANAVASNCFETVIENGKQEKKPLLQSDGVVYDRAGRITHYIVCAKADSGPAKMTDATVLSAGVVRLYGHFWRVNQMRGIPEIGLIALELEDIKEMRARELDTAKATAALAFTVTRSESSAIEAALKAANADPDAMIEQGEELLGDQAEGTETGDGAITASSADLPRYEKLEQLAGGCTEYLDEGDKVENVIGQRPNMQVGEFSKYVHGSAGAGLGLAGAFASWSADKSYFAFQGDMILSWPTFEEIQKDLEYSICDPCWVSVIGNAIKDGKLPPGPDGWEYAAAWSWPRMPQADKVKYWRAVGDAMRLGGMSFSDLHGPDWKQRIDDAAAQADYARERMPWLSLFETKAGAPLAETEERDDEQT